jgi:rubredoxin
MNASGNEAPKRYEMKFRCRICHHEWLIDFIGTMFGTHGVLAATQDIQCPECGASKDNQDPAKDAQPEMVRMDESNEFLVFGRIDGSASM